MTPLDAPIVLRRFLILRASRWLPTSLIAPVLILYLLDRGLSLVEVGMAVAAMGLVVMVLELPTGGLADAVGRRRVLLVANGFDLAAMVLLLLSPSLVWILLASAIEGIYRALESGPLDAWYVDTSRDVDPDTDVEHGLSRGGVVLGVALATGAVVSGALVWLDPFPWIEALAVPFIVAIALRLLDTALVARLMSGDRRDGEPSGIAASIKQVPGIVRSAFALVLGSTVLTLIISVELFWGFGMASWETLFPARLEQLLASAEDAAALMGPVTAAAWLAFAAGAAVVPWFTRRIGPYAAAAWMRLLQAASVLAMGVFAGVIGMITAYLLCLVVHGAANPVHLALVHEHAESASRTTVASLNSMVGMTAAAIGAVVLGAVADQGGTSAGMYLGAAMLAAGAPLYWLAARAESAAGPVDRIPTDQRR